MPLPAFFVKSAEVIPCPCCGGQLSVIGSRPRKSIKGSGEVIQLVIRRLRCGDCRRIHHELPDLLIPYKRYDAESIEHVITEPTSLNIAADESTLYRWRSWFLAWLTYAQGCLQSIAIRFDLPVGNPSFTSQSALLSIGRYVGDATGWLVRAVRPIANLNLWIHTRSAFLS